VTTGPEFFHHRAGPGPEVKGPAELPVPVGLSLTLSTLAEDIDIPAQEVKTAGAPQAGA